MIFSRSFSNADSPVRRLSAGIQSYALGSPVLFSEQTVRNTGIKPKARVSMSYATSDSSSRINTLRVMHSNPHGRPGYQLLGHSWTLDPCSPFYDSLHIL